MKTYILFALLSLVIVFSGAETAFSQTRTVTTTHRSHRGWSNRAKGAAIGGGAGAIVGGIAGHSVGGALLGGAVGAGAGYVIGNETDKNKSHARRRHVTVRRTVTK